MNKSRTEAFSDGVFAIIITIMVLEIKVPAGDGWDALRQVMPVLLSYVLSFIFIGIYWVNHHHLLHTARHVDGSILWMNIHLLFWLSLVPVATGWMGQTHFASKPVAAYAILLLLCAIAFTILQLRLEKTIDASEKLRKAFQALRRKGIFSVICYLAALGFAFINTTVSGILFLVVSVIWFIPDRHIEKALEEI